ncbi:hypothetical protein L1987_40843 [Smallanthus sonchifolius]|uniref:Uncharacterized protein n=1 Tax=Smallanthus sonchifolius TaxID=185202 RepID=A0ACB9GUY0_9ASTR|nr:hypothetical protein L1987_40843 [Smallanthus sonchifolius]
MPGGNEESIVQSNFNESERGKEGDAELEDDSVFNMKSILWHGGSAWDAWFSCSSNQVAQVLLTLPYSFWQLGMASGIVLQVFYGLLGSWTAYLISVLYVEYRSRKEKENVDFKKHVIQKFYKHISPEEPESFIIYREIMHAMWKPQKFKYIYFLATLYVFTLTLPSSAAVYWAFGDKLLNHSNAFSLLPKTRWRDAAVILMLIHQLVVLYNHAMHYGYLLVIACISSFFLWTVYYIWIRLHAIVLCVGKGIGMHDTKSIFLRALARLPVVIPIWFLAIIFPFFGPINSAVGALLVSFTVYIIPALALAHMLTYRTPSARQNAAEKPPRFISSWTAMYVLNAFVVVWVLVVGFGFGGWASMTNFVRQVDTFGLFAKCHQCKPVVPPPPRKH